MKLDEAATARPRGLSAQARVVHWLRHRSSLSRIFVVIEGHNSVVSIDIVVRADVENTNGAGRIEDIELVR